MRIGLLVSGNLGNIIFEKLLSDKQHSIAFVYTDFQSNSIIDACIKHNILCFKGNPRGGKSKDFLNQVSSPELILSVNYLFIVEEDVISKASKYAINIHGSLLPKYRGRTPHVWAIINNEPTSGITAHLIEKGCDEGDIVKQVEIPIKNWYTGQDLLNEFNKAYPILVNQILTGIESNSLTFTKQDSLKSTFFGKRTAEDGYINFEWQKERIYNWVRAQSSPYPGAFAFFNNEKIVIHKIDFTDYGFQADQQNGMIVYLENQTPFIKVQNGVIKLSQIEGNYKFKIGDVLK